MKHNSVSVVNQVGGVEGGIVVGASVVVGVAGGSDGITGAGGCRQL